ncbi:MAG: hypothetical protein M3Z11_01610 [Candidatus Dormibacteraeota bacterium]|nr:hypothetical protein [Candidatus Dormibacteraeota bacterium]
MTGENFLLTPLVAGGRLSTFQGAWGYVRAGAGVLGRRHDSCTFPPPALSFSHVIFKSADGGQTFGPETTISDVTSASPTGLFKLGEHHYMRDLEFPSLAIDPSGNVYDSWNDGRSGKSHVLIARSSDSGTTWTVNTVTAGANDEATGPQR